MEVKELLKRCGISASHLARETDEDRFAMCRSVSTGKWGSERWKKLLLALEAIEKEIHQWLQDHE